MIVFTNDLRVGSRYAHFQVSFRAQMLFVSFKEVHSVLSSTMLPNNHANQAYGVPFGPMFTLCPLKTTGLS